MTTLDEHAVDPPGAVEGRGPKVGSADTATIDRELAGAYSFLQLVIGVLAVALPAVVLTVDWLFGDRDWFTTRGSISAYYYARGGGWFVGTLCVTAFFFLSYKYAWNRRDKVDFIVTKVASVAALGVALFPTPSEGSSSNLVGVIHYVSAFVLFGLLTFLVLFSFTKSAADLDRTFGEAIRRVFSDTPAVRLLPGKARRNRLYRLTGWSMVVVLLASLVYSRIEASWPDSGLAFLPSSWFFFAESIVVILFGFVWLLKSQRVPVLPSD